MGAHAHDHAQAARRARLVGAGTAVLEVVLAVFLLLMASLTVADTGRALVAGAVVALLAALLVLGLGRSERGAGGVVWASRLLPVVAAAVVLVPASVGWTSWLVVPLVVFAGAPAAAVGLVLPPLLRPATPAS